jgi:hypothetical protein
MTTAGRYVQGGGCTTVGVAGLVQGGGFGSFSKGSAPPGRTCWRRRSSPQTGPCAEDRMVMHARGFAHRTIAAGPDHYPPLRPRPTSTSTATPRTRSAPPSLNRGGGRSDAPTWAGPAGVCALSILRRFPDDEGVADGRASVVDLPAHPLDSPSSKAPPISPHRPSSTRHWSNQRPKSSTTTTPAAASSNGRCPTRLRSSLTYVMEAP